MESGSPNAYPAIPGGGAQVSFQRSLLPILVADDERRYIDVNAAACLFLRLPRRRVLELRIDDLTPPENRAALEDLWQDFLAAGTQAGMFELVMPDGQRVRAAYSASASEDGRNLSILDPHHGEDEESIAASALPAEQGALTAREREVLALVAMGATGHQIAAELGISMATVETHIRRSLVKLEAKNRPHAVLIALRRGDLALL